MQKARLKVENLHYDLSEEDLTVLYRKKLGLTGRIYSVRLDQSKGYI